MDLNLLIGSEQCAAHQGATFTRANPLTGDVVTQAAAASAGDAVRAVEGGREYGGAASRLYRTHGR